MTVDVKFDTLSKNYPSPEEFTHDQLFEELGWDDLIGNESYANTCAIRMSYCLIRSGISVAGRLQIKTGDHKGKWIEPGQKRLSKTLAVKAMFGTPKIFALKDRAKEIGRQQGIVSFMSIPGYVIDGALSGHIDLVKGESYYYFWDQFTCSTHCYWDAKAFWFWPLN